MFVGDCYFDDVAKSFLASGKETHLPLSRATSSDSIHEPPFDVDPVTSSRCSNDRKHQWFTITRRCFVSCNIFRRTIVALSDFGLKKLFP